MTNEKIEVSELLSIDSPMVVSRIDLDSLGRTGGTGRGGGSGAETGETGSSLSTPHVQYVAICDDVFHGPGTDGALEDGLWLSYTAEQHYEVVELARQHICEGRAFVAMYVDGVLVGPVVQH